MSKLVLLPLETAYAAANPHWLRCWLTVLETAYTAVTLYKFNARVLYYLETAYAAVHSGLNKRHLYAFILETAYTAVNIFQGWAEST